MNIIHGNWLSKVAIEEIEENHNAKFICYTPLNTRDGSYINQPCAIFYAEEAHPNGSNWFALFHDYMNRLVIANAIEVENRIITGLMRGNDVIYSTHRHDMVCFSEQGSPCIDGGMDYTKVNGSMNECRMVNLKVTKDGLVFDGGI